MIQLFFWLLWVFLVFGCEGIAKLDKRLSTDVKLIGVWKGKHQEKGSVLKQWVQTRNADGTYVIEFSFTEKMVQQKI